MPTYTAYPCDCCNNPCWPIGGDCPELTSGSPVSIQMSQNPFYDSASGGGTCNFTHVVASGLFTVPKFNGCLWAGSVRWCTVKIERVGGEWVLTYTVQYTGPHYAGTLASETGDWVKFKGTGDIIAAGGGGLVLTYDSSSDASKWGVGFDFPVDGSTTITIVRSCLFKCNLNTTTDGEVCSSAPPEIAVTLESSDTYLDGLSLTAKYRGGDGTGSGLEYWFAGYMDGPNERLVNVFIYCDKLRNGALYDGYKVFIETYCLSGYTYVGEVGYFTSPVGAYAHNYSTPAETTAALVCTGGLFLGETDQQTITSGVDNLPCYGGVPYNETIKFHLLG